MTRVLVEEYYKSCTRLMTMTLSSLKQCSCGRNEDDGRQFTTQPQINVYYSTAVSYIRTRVRTFPANNTFYTSVGSETGLKKRILFCPNICGLENKRSRSTSFQGSSANICGLENKRSRSTGFQGGSASTSPHQPQSRDYLDFLSAPVVGTVLQKTFRFYK
jgi:hypothetical protein